LIHFCKQKFLPPTQNRIQILRSPGSQPANYIHNHFFCRTKVTLRL
jgi:hypothetical protein